jgi:hypothetical protein
MREIIKNILIEYQTTFFEIKFHSFSNYLLNEEIRANKREIKELGYEPTPISDAEESTIKYYLSTINKGQDASSLNYNPESNGIIGIHKMKDGKENRVRFFIRLTRHWFFRLHRTEDPKFKNLPKIIDPKPFESIDAINSNADLLARFVTQKQPHERLVWELNSPNGLNILASFVPLDINGTVYDIVLTNQIKGLDFYDRVSKNKIPLR